MKFIKIILTVLFVTLLNLNSFSFAEILKFDACSYEGDVKKGKAEVQVLAFFQMALSMKDNSKK